MRPNEADQSQEILDDEYVVIHHPEREHDRGGDVEDGQGITIASRWPVVRSWQVDLHVTPRTGGFACTALCCEISAPDPIGTVLFVNHLPDYQLDHEHERELQAVALATAIETRIAEGGIDHVVVAGDLDADPVAASLRFWTGRQSLQETSVCYRDAWESRHGSAPGPTFVPDNPLSRDPDWPFRQIDHILVRCRASGPSLLIQECERALNEPIDDVQASDHYGVRADLRPPEA